jgi:hypothetical protein
LLLELLGTAREPLPECHPPDAAWSRPGSAFLKASHGGCADVPRTTQWSQQVTLVHRRDSSRQSVDPWWTIVFADVCRCKICPNVSHVQVKIKLRAAGHAGIPPTPLQVELHWNYHSAPHDDLHSEAPNLRQKSLANDKQLLFSQW